MKPYKTLRFDEGKIPEGLLRDHSLKAGVRGCLRVTHGELVFVDESGAKARVSAGEHVSIAPQTPHHLEDTEHATIEIDFFHAGE